MSPARRPHFDRLPKVARTGSRNGLLLVGRQKDGSWLAVRLNSSRSSSYAMGASRRDVGLLLRPPALPFLIALGIAVLGFGLWYLTRKQRSNQGTGPPLGWGRIARLGAAALLVEATMVLYGTYRFYF